MATLLAWFGYCYRQTSRIPASTINIVLHSRRVSLWFPIIILILTTTQGAGAEAGEEAATPNVITKTTPFWSTVITTVVPVATFCIILVEKVKPWFMKSKRPVVWNHPETELYCVIFSCNQDPLYLSVMTIPIALSDLDARKTEDRHVFIFQRKLWYEPLKLQMNAEIFDILNNRIMLREKVSVPLSQHWGFDSIAQNLQSVQFRLGQGETHKTISKWYKNEPLIPQLDQMDDNANKPPTSSPAKDESTVPTLIDIPSKSTSRDSCTPQSESPSSEEDINVAAAFNTEGAMMEGL